MCSRKNVFKKWEMKVEAYNRRKAYTNMTAAYIMAQDNRIVYTHSTEQFK